MLVIALILAASTLEGATVRFVSPAPGAQAIGPQLLEVTTDAAKVDRVEFYVDGVLAGVARRVPFRVAFDFGTSLEARAVTAKVFSNGYRQIDTASITTAALTAGESLTVDYVEVPLRVRSSRPLRASDFRVRENGVEQMIRDVRADRGPATFVFVIDRSLSMDGGRLEAALRAVDSARPLLRHDDTVTVILFNHNVTSARTVAPRDALPALFGAVTTSGGTSLRDAVASIPAAQRTYAFVITDGGDRNSRLSEDEALRKISRSHTVVDAIVLGDASRFLHRAASNTGGRVVEASRETIAKALRDLIVDINSRYTLSYQSSGGAKGWRAIAIAPRRGGITVVNARKGYFAE